MAGLPPWPRVVAEGGSASDKSGRDVHGRRGGVMRESGQWGAGLTTQRSLPGDWRGTVGSGLGEQGQSPTRETAASSRR